MMDSKPEAAPNSSQQRRPCESWGAGELGNWFFDGFPGDVHRFPLICNRKMCAKSRRSAKNHENIMDLRERHLFLFIDYSFMIHPLEMWNKQKHEGCGAAFVFWVSPGRIQSWTETRRTNMRIWPAWNLLQATNPKRWYFCSGQNYMLNLMPCTN